MGVCSYCYSHQPSWEECYSWDQAEGCAGITGPNDPKRLERKSRYSERRAASLRDEAKRVRDRAEAEAVALERQAASYEADILPRPHPQKVKP